MSMCAQPFCSAIASMMSACNSVSSLPRSLVGMPAATAAVVAAATCKYSDGTEDDDDVAVAMPSMLDEPSDAAALTAGSVACRMTVGGLAVPPLDATVVVDVVEVVVEVEVAVEAEVEVEVGAESSSERCEGSSGAAIEILGVSAGVVGMSRCARLVWLALSSISAE